MSISLVTVMFVDAGSDTLLVWISLFVGKRVRCGLLGRSCNTRRYGMDMTVGCVYRRILRIRELLMLDGW